MAMSPASDGGAILPPGVGPLEADDPPEAGGHTLVGRLGSGGMGIVYLGHDDDGQLVAVKAARTADETSLRRFRAEAASARRIPGPYTARLLSDGTDREPPYIVTEYVEGRPLEDIVEGHGPLPFEQLRALATGAARALAAIHGAGLVHRDLKPGNVLLTATGPRVIDFGIAQEIPASGGLTDCGVVVGSPGWIAPERLTRHPATPAADVFGWGCLVTYAGTGRNPFGEGDPDQVALRTIHGQPDLDGVEASLRPLVARSLAKDPAERPTAAALLALLSPEEALAEPEPPRTRLLARPDRRRRTRVLAAGSAVAVAVTLAATAAQDGERTRPYGRHDRVTASPPPLAEPPDAPVPPRPVPSARGERHGTASSPPAPRGSRTSPAVSREPRPETPAPITSQVTSAVNRATARTIDRPPGKTINELLGQP
jgi:serine/threonine protein kinase